MALVKDWKEIDKYDDIEDFEYLEDWKIKIIARENHWDYMKEFII
jgi:hypothetical protein